MSSVSSFFSYIMVKTWKQEKIPCEWPEEILCPKYKNGDREQCKYYRGIFLLNITYKIFAILLYNRLSKIIEPEIRNYQMGFRPNRSIIDNIFIVRQIYEKCHEYNINLHNIHSFIYFAFHWSYTDVELVIYTFSIINKASVHKLCLIVAS